jgi:hypothetical protein
MCFCYDIERHCNHRAITWEFADGIRHKWVKKWAPLTFHKGIEMVSQEFELIYVDRWCHGDESTFGLG